MVSSCLCLCIMCTHKYCICVAVAVSVRMCMVVWSYVLPSVLITTPLEKSVISL